MRINYKLNPRGTLYGFTLQSTTPPVSQGPCRNKILFIVTVTRHADNGADTNLCTQQCAAKKRKKKRQTHKYKAVQREHELISQKETGLIIKTILKDTEMHSGRPGKRREELRDGYNRSVRGSCCENEENKRQSEMGIKKKRKKRKTQHACFRRCRNSSGAAINPDAKKNKKPEHGNMANKQSGDSALAQLHWFPAQAFF